MSVPAPQPSPAFRETFAALRHRDYRLWFGGQFISLTGMWMQSAAQGFLVYQLTHSRAYLGYVGFAAGLPAWLFTLYGGVIADRMSRRRMIVATQTSMMLLAFVLAVLVFAGVVRPWHILVLALCGGVVNAFDAPARQVLVVDMVAREDLTNAIALNSTMFNAATVLGPAVGGAVYAWFGPAWCFTINGISYLAVIAGLLMMRMHGARPAPPRASVLADLREGFAYMGSDASARAIVATVGAVSVVGVGLVTLMPAWSVNILHGGVRLNGVLLSARGAGAMIGALMIAALGQRRFRGRLLTLGTVLLPLTLLLFAGLRWLPAVVAILVGVGWSFMVIVNTSLALLQTRLPDALRGRVMSIYTMVFFGSMPIGALASGFAAHRWGEPAAVAGGAVLLLLFAGFAWWRWPTLRRLP
ncbi:MAG: MFS transporter [Candidatus Krumholzibacteriia bacterium]